MKKLYFSLFSLLFFFGANAQIVNIPDANFKAKLLEANSDNNIASVENPDENGSVSNYSTIDTNEDGEIQVSEAILIKTLTINSCNISNLEGINSFSNLQYLNCGANYLTSLNVSNLSSLKSLSCGINPITNLNLNGLIDLQKLLCNNTQLTSVDLSSLINLKEVYCSGINLSNLNISGLTNLEILDCSNSALTNINLVGLVNLKFLFCSFNLLTSIDLSGLASLQNLICDANQLTSLNLQGLINLRQLSCYSNQLTSINVQGLTSLQYFGCVDNQITSLDVQGLTNLQYLECSQNDLSTLNVQGLTSLLELICSENELTLLNLQDLPNLNRLVCNNNLLTSLDVDEMISIQYLNCTDNQLTSLNIKNGANFFELYFNNNPNLQFICADEQELEDVQNLIILWGFTNCHVNSYCSFTPGGTYYTIQGDNKFDANSNGCDASDVFFPNLKYSISDGTNSGNLISNASGNYSIPVSVGTHTITPQFENPSYFTSSPTSTTVGFPATASPFIQDFCIVPNGVHHDLEVVIIPLDPARPGFDATYKIKYKNKGTVSENPTVVFNFDDDVLDYVSSTLAPTTTSTGSISWNIGTIIPFQSGELVVTLNVNSPMETPAVNGGDVLSYTTTINGISADEYIRDNTFPLRQIVVNSYDPNDKTCLEGTTINPTMIGEYVHYQIRFENTGTFPAQNVVVKDIIDTTKFDIATLQIVDTSHNCVTKITNPNKVEFIFENINLPFDDATNDGFLVFKIRTNPTLTVGSTISNLANIYFDYNFPIVTNTATSTFQSLANNTFNFENYVSIAPNPAKDVLNITIQKEVGIKSIAIYNMLGQLVQIITNPTNSINVSDLETGNYIVKLYSEKGEIIRKFIKE